jgi:preprotein translocase subunit YajC
MNQGAAGLFGPGSPLIQLAPFAMILVVFYFLLVRPQQKKARETQAMLDGLRVNDDVVTTGGLHGKIVKLVDKIVIIEIAPKVQVRVDRPAVSAVVRAGKGGDGRPGNEKSSEEKSA